MIGEDNFSYTQIQSLAWFSTMPKVYEGSEFVVKGTDILTQSESISAPLAI